jgi:hypothetical protein
MNRVFQGIAGATALAVLTPSGVAQTPAGSIQHQPLSCIVRDTHALVEAGYPTSKEGRVYFRAAGTEEFYWVPFQRKPGTALSSSLLPKPHPTTEKIEYYVAAGDPLPPAKGKKGDQSIRVPLNEEKTASYTPIVSTMTYCENKALTVKQAPDTEKVSIALGLTRWGQSAVPQGFMKAGISSVILPNGVTTSLAAALKAGGTTSAAAGGGGGMSTLAIVGASVAVAGGAAAAVVSASNNNSTSDNGCAGFSEAKLQQLASCYAAFVGNFSSNSTITIPQGAHLLDRRNGGCSVIDINNFRRVGCTFSMTNSSMSLSSSLISGGGPLLVCLSPTSTSAGTVAGAWSQNLMLATTTNYNSLCASVP